MPRRRKRDVQLSQIVGELKAKAWELHLRGATFPAIGEALGISRNTASGYIRAMYEDLAQDRHNSLNRPLNEAIERIRRVQAQAWADHDGDDERERQVLATVAPEGQSPPRFLSQRAQYLRVILECEREIARLRGLNGALVMEDTPQVVFRIEKIERVEVSVTPVEPEAAVAGSVEVVALPTHTTTAGAPPPVDPESDDLEGL